ncbi:MAG: fatty acid desaturase [Cyanobacteria bacterium P01_A01_bin.45]
MTISTVNTSEFGDARSNKDVASDLDSPTFKLQDIIKSLPKECFELNPTKAWISLFISVSMVFLGYTSLIFAPWFLLPVAWIFTGTALTGFFVIGHDCAHRSFSKKVWVNDLVGHLVMMPLIYPFHSWRIKHNYHHLHTNKLNEDNAWHPIRPDVYETWHPVAKWGFRRIMLNRLWWLASILHWANLHFNPSNFREKDRSDIKLSVAVVGLFAVVAFPSLIITGGIWAFVKFWFIPWLGYHFWMSTFTLVHHTNTEVPFTPEPEWNAAIAQLSGSVHCDYPRWVEFLCHDINVHVPHHISTAIPAYKLRLAQQSLRENWGSYMLSDRRFSWSLMKEITDECNLYIPGDGYISFKEYHAKN